MRVIYDGRAYAETYTNLCFCVRKGYTRRGTVKNGISRAIGFTEVVTLLLLISAIHNSS